METTIPLMTRLMVCLLVIKTFADNASAMFYTPQNNESQHGVKKAAFLTWKYTRILLKKDQMLRMVPDVTDDSTMDTELIKTRMMAELRADDNAPKSGPKYL